ncbi:conserved hypothetical protein [Talaromyces stipitatus ATCC 10500]|uniref:DUF1746 domain-containing protein n=1 Tax=Talaromyces stipitatus (strain ATCC 10500 / CBS 375.48 / QM 6759 / NRRL 1006) TaxID=441959 RepID=B8MA87_TALSN|nr:uncharacterized protein TSTA_123180 [Talaromyces stipitatus ATCC 10500]EED18589.1 conserved hypothetical protein [Talaromyces stipitatus ATCC 10500]
MTTPDAFRDAEHFADVSGIPDVADYADVDQPLTSAQQDLWQKVQRKTKIALIDRLLRELDVVIYCELAALYYMDCTFFLFAIRVIVQLIFFTPKAPPFEPTRSQPYVGTIFTVNSLCMFLHTVAIHPSAGEETRGYLHGGLFIDFVGQKAPVSRIRLVIFDFLIMLIHLVMLGLILERVRIGENRESTTQDQESPTDTEDGTNPGQDHDAEERGVLRNETDNDESSSSSPPERPRDSSLERTALLAEPAEDGSSPQLRNSHPLDTFVSGEALILDMGLFETIHDQWRHNTGNRPRTAFTPSQETTTFLREHLGVSVGPDGRVLRFQR